MIKDKTWPNLLPGLSLPVGFIYFWSNNVTVFTGQSFLFSFILLVAISFALFCFCKFVVSWGVREFIQEKWQTVFFALIVAFLSAVCALWIVNYNLWQQRRIWSLAFFIIAFFLIKFNRAKILAIFLVILICLSGCSFLYKFCYLHYQQSRILAAMKREEPQLHFVRKPNIYVYWLESFQDIPRLEKVFDIDMNHLEAFLKANHFHIENGVYSSGDHTLKSMSQLYSTRKIDDIARLSAVSESLWLNRDIIGGSYNNYVYRILKENGYNTYLILTDHQQYCMTAKHEYLDETSFAPTFVYRFFSPIFSFLYPSIKNIFKYTDNVDFQETRLVNGYPQGLLEQVKHAINRAKLKKMPFILSFKGGAIHTPHSHYTWHKKKEWLESKLYKNLALASNKITEEILSFIIRNDPDSIIVILGDHGPYLYLGFPIDKNDAFEEVGLTPKEFMDDRFNVFFAWRMPNGDNYDLSQGMYMNNINLFTHIFAWMANDKSILEKRVRSESEFGSLKAIEGLIQNTSH